MKILSHAAVWAAAFVRLVFLSLLLGASGTALAATDAERIAQTMKTEFDRPGLPLSVEPVNVDGAFAIAGWSQAGSGGRAMLQRIGNQWQITLCAGDALLKPATLTGSGMTPDAAVRLIANVRIAESRLPATRREVFSRFMGMVKVANASGSKDVSVSNSWTRATPAGSTVGVAYLTIVNHGTQSDTLVSLTSPVAAMVELHRTIMENGISRMRPAGQIVIAPGQTVKVQTGALHVMLMELKKPLVAGTKVPLVLQFRQAGAITVQMDVQPVTFAPQEEHTGH